MNYQIHFKVLKEFKSKRNKVSLVEYKTEKYILKKFTNAKSLEKEYEVLTKLASCGYAPIVKAKGEDCLINEYIEGELLIDLFETYAEDENADELTELANYLSVYLQIFHSVVNGSILEDVNFRNYIIRDKRCYGIDYEAVIEGMPYKDVAGVIAFAVSYDLGNIYSIKPFILKVLENFHYTAIDIINEVKDYLILIEKRREGHINIDYLLDFLLNIDANSKKSNMK